MRQYYKGAWILALSITFVGILLSTVWWGVSAIKASVLNHLTEVHLLQRGVIENEIEGQAILIRKEELLIAPSNGTLAPVAKEGERVRAGALVAQLAVNTVQEGVEPAKLKVRAPRPGLVSYEVDGLESIVTLNQFEQLGYDRIYQKLEQEKAQELEKPEPNNYASGEPLCKVVDNLSPFYLALRLPKESKSMRLEAGNSMRIGFLGVLEEKVTMRIQKVEQLKEGYEILLSFTPTGNELLKWRNGSVMVTKTRHEGFLVAKSALIKHGKQDGVFIVYKESARFEPVEVVGVSEEKVIIVGAKAEGKVSRIGINARVVVNPQFVREGQKVQ